MTSPPIALCEMNANTAGYTPAAETGSSEKVEGFPPAPLQYEERKSILGPRGMRGFLVCGNWKCNGSVSIVSKLMTDIRSSLKTFDNNYDEDDVLVSRRLLIPSRVPQVLVAPPQLHLVVVQGLLAKCREIEVAAQDCSRFMCGPHTGEAAASMLMDMEVRHCILGHSERRHSMGETDEIVGAKVSRALEADMRTIIVCVGETDKERNRGETEDVLARQLAPVLKAVQNHAHHVSDPNTDNHRAPMSQDQAWMPIVIAYEPVWAIGTGRAATCTQVAEALQFIRRWVARECSKALAVQTRVLYGGSVEPTNCGLLAALPDVDGFLVGGSSLKASAFADIVRMARETLREPNRVSINLAGTRAAFMEALDQEKIERKNLKDAEGGDESENAHHVFFATPVA